MDEHIILVAVSVEAPTRVDAMLAVGKKLPRPGTVVFEHGSNPCTIDSWWIAEDDRNDRSDNDSAVFVKPGLQYDAHKLLGFADITPAHHLPAANKDLARTRWEPHVDDDTPLDLLMRVAEDVSREETPDPDDVERLRAMFADDQ